jgi:hypothetical protein
MREYGVSTLKNLWILKPPMTALIEPKSSRLWRNFQYPENFSSLVEITLRNVRCKVKTPSGITDPSDTKKGLQQEDALSCMLFNSALEKAVGETNLDIRGTILHKSVQILAYADDDVIVARYENSVKDAFNRLQKASQKM